MESYEISWAVTEILAVIAIGCVLVIIIYRPWFHRWPVTKWLRWYSLAAAADIASTFFAVYIGGLDWSDELNEYIQWLAPKIGYDAATLVHTAFSIAIVYALWVILQIFFTEERLTMRAFKACLIFITVLRIAAPINNVIQIFVLRGI